MTKICKHCGMDTAKRNPSGYCDHLHYPDNCEICKNSGIKKLTLRKILKKYIDKHRELGDTEYESRINQAEKEIKKIIEARLTQKLRKMMFNPEIIHNLLTERIK